MRKIVAEAVSSRSAITKTCRRMVIDHAHRLHERITNRRTHKTETAFFQILAHRIGLGSFCRNVFRCNPLVAFWFSADKLPNIFIEAPEFLPRSEERRVGKECR